MSTSASSAARARLGRGIALGTAALFAALGTCIVVPPWSLAMLSVRVAAIELSPALAILDLAALLLILRLLRGARALRRMCAVVLVLATALSLVPLARFGATARRASAQLRAPPARFSFATMLRGLPVGSEVIERRVSYTAADGSPLVMRLYRGAARGPRPTVVVIYGGAWRAGGPAQAGHVSRALAALGFTVVAIDYRHAPRFIFPAQLDDVRRSLGLLRDSAPAWGIDPARIAALGRSAGGHLAELAAFTTSTGAPSIRAVVAIYAPFDLVQGYRDPPSPDPLDVRAVLRDFLAGAPEQQLARYRAASPSSYVRSGLPSVLLLYGASDHAVKPSFNRAAADALRRARVPVVQVEIPWAEHGFDIVPAGLGGQLGFTVLVQFLERVLASS